MTGRHPTELTLVPRPWALSDTGARRTLRERTLRVAGPAELVGAVTALADRCRGLAVAVAEPAAADVVVDIRPRWRGGVDGDPVRGLDPGGADDAPPDGFSITVVDRRLRVCAAGSRGAFHALTAVVQVVADPTGDTAELPLFEAEEPPGMLRWRGLSLDVARRFCPLDELRTMVDLMAYYRLNVLHLHLTDAVAWRLRMPGRPRLTPDPQACYDAAQLVELARYAAARHVTVLPEIDMPGHILAAVTAYPELGGDKPPPHPGMAHLRPDVPAATAFAQEAVDLLCGLSPSPYVHIGGDEAFGMDADEYARFVQAAHGWVRARGKRPVAWQEASRGRVFGPEDVLQLWISPQDAPRAEELDRRLPAQYAFLRDTLLETFRSAPQDLPRAVADGAHVLLSPSFPFYLDRRYGEPSTDPAQTASMERLGHAGYPVARTSHLYSWQLHDIAEAADGTARVAGAEAVLWTETTGDADDLAALLLPRLPLLAEMMWSTRRSPWPAAAARIAAHAPVWQRLGLGGYYRSAEVFG
ncbi:family 20 glycosylhydrolase [Micromonospora sp. CPCC 205561]|uniref:family 20 glycosylhydrolase n=1 Tax=Micromonospora sp. CPCC 205561 TaxID=3122407 RepID=UPI002FF02B31